MVKGTGGKFFESIPLYPRYVLRVGTAYPKTCILTDRTQIKLVHNQSVKSVLKDNSIRQGKTHSSAESVKSILSFVETYFIQLGDLEEPDINGYKTFNEFFCRYALQLFYYTLLFTFIPLLYNKLKVDARPLQNSDDLLAIRLSSYSLLHCRPKTSLSPRSWERVRDLKSYSKVLEYTQISIRSQVVNYGHPFTFLFRHLYQELMR
ncbi:hypothetical protein QCA50_020526 [Cerrena zonata]|uniref:Uncharacterized protein n=1 Tax=Cerrena zonata TaxID=2478898 RepID=A0AAW0F808_9APHY